MNVSAAPASPTANPASSASSVNLHTPGDTNDRAYEIIGVMPAGFRFVQEDVDLWTAAQLDRSRPWRETEGRIINVASVAGITASDPRVVRTVSYNATKHGVVGLTRQLAAEWGVHGITVNAICPGFFPSKMTKVTLERIGTEVIAMTPLARLGGDEDLKGSVVFLASEASRHITGHALVVDGGCSAV